MTGSGNPLGERPILFAGGGTGGHLFPGLAVAAELRRRRPSRRIVFAGSERALDERLVGEQGFEFRALPSESLATWKRRPWRFVSRLVQSLWAARRLRRELNPSMIVGLGGFASAPLVWSGRGGRTPILLLEQNAIPGRATRWLGRYASRMAMTFPESLDRLPPALRERASVTGNPVRESLVELAGKPRPPQTPPLLLVLGGSQGSHSVNLAMLAAARTLRERLAGWRIVHQTGAADEAFVRAAYAELHLSAEVAAFLSDVPEVCSKATLAVSRAGATTLAELACAGLPAILIPYPHAADDHQQANARAFERDGAAIVVMESAVGGDNTAMCLTARLSEMIGDSDRLRSMENSMRRQARPEATKAVADLIESLLRL